MTGGLWLLHRVLGCRVQAFVLALWLLDKAWYGFHMVCKGDYHRPSLTNPTRCTIKDLQYPESPLPLNPLHYRHYIIWPVRLRFKVTSVIMGFVHPST